MAKQHLDPSSFPSIKSQGQANVVFNYTGDSAALQHTVLRVAKKRAPVLSHLSTDDHRNLSFETFIWRVHPFPPPTPIEYIKHVMAYIISSTYIPSDLKEVPIDDHFIQQLTTLSGLSLSGPTATLLSDATLLPNYQQQHLLPTIAIELKPKWGSYSQCPTIHPNHKSIKATTTRYQLLQRYKRAVLKTIAEESNYDPVDLFSLQKDRMRHALVSLFQIPHNNLTLFRNGDRIERNTTTTTTNNNNQWEDEMNAFVDGVFPDWKGLLDTIIQILLQEKVLKNILKAQNICGMDIEGVYRVYDAFIRKGGGGIQDLQLAMLLLMMVRMINILLPRSNR
jgi:hypothetical protein